MDDPIRRRSRVIYWALGWFMLISSVSLTGDDVSESAVPQQELALSKAARTVPAPVPTTPLPERTAIETTKTVYLMSTRMNVFSQQTAHIFLILKHMLLEPLKFRSNYVNSHAYLRLALQ